MMTTVEVQDKGRVTDDWAHRVGLTLCAATQKAWSDPDKLLAGEVKLGKVTYTDREYIPGTRSGLQAREVKNVYSFRVQVVYKIADPKAYWSNYDRRGALSADKENVHHARSEKIRRGASLAVRNDNFDVCAFYLPTSDTVHTKNYMGGADSYSVEGVFYLTKRPKWITPVSNLLLWAPVVLLVLLGAMTAGTAVWRAGKAGELVN